MRHISVVLSALCAGWIPIAACSDGASSGARRDDSGTTGGVGGGGSGGLGGIDDGSVGGTGASSTGGIGGAGPGGSGGSATGGFAGSETGGVAGGLGGEGGDGGSAGGNESCPITGSAYCTFINGWEAKCAPDGHATFCPNDLPACWELTNGQLECVPAESKPCDPATYQPHCEGDTIFTCQKLFDGEGATWPANCTTANQCVNPDTGKVRCARAPAMCGDGRANPGPVCVPNSVQSCDGLTPPERVSPIPSLMEGGPLPPKPLGEKYPRPTPKGSPVAPPRH